MQLTPRNLVMACGAMLAGGAVFGVITTLAPAVSLPTATALPLPLRLPLFTRPPPAGAGVAPRESAA